MATEGWSEGPRWLESRVPYTLNDESVLLALRKLGARCGKDQSFVTMADLCRALSATPFMIEPIARRLESEGSIICAPTSGRIAVVCLSDRYTE